MSKDKSLTPRKEHGLTKSEQTGQLIDRHLGMIVDQPQLDLTPDELLYEKVKAFVIETREPSIRFVCRKFGLNCVQAHTLFDQMEQEKVVKTGLEGRRCVLPPSNEPPIQDNDGLYFGELLGGKPHGFGSWRHPDGERIVGEWRYGQPSGWVIATFPDGIIYDGMLKEKKRAGFGIELTSDVNSFGVEEVHAGNWADDLEHGSMLYTRWKWEQDEHVFEQFEQEWEHGELVSTRECKNDPGDKEEESYSGSFGLHDPLYLRAVSLVISKGRRGHASVKGLCDCLMISWDRAAELIQAMEAECVIGPSVEPDRTKSYYIPRREILWGRLSDVDEAACGEDDPLYQETITLIKETGDASVASVQRHFLIGYERAARMIDALEEAGLVGPLENGKRKIYCHEGN